MLRCTQAIRLLALPRSGSSVPIGAPCARRRQAPGGAHNVALAIGAMKTFRLLRLSYVSIERSRGSCSV
eukprot:1906679-Prymnesium_polylepis.1